ncbi:MAG: hypothetical protein VW881_04170 [Alphaproteobacteria bacterium]
MNALTARPVPQPPALIAHADWSTNPKKRAIARALRMADGSYTALTPEPVRDLPDLFARLRAAAGAGGTALMGFDFPIGLPRAYAKAARIDRFVPTLRQLGHGSWKFFYDPAEDASQISVRRPFYPQRPGGTKRQHLIDALGLSGAHDLFRRCDRPTDLRGAASPLFWTLGAQQVGKAAISGWRDLIAPALRSDPSLRIWPFDGRLAEMLSQPGIVIAETYPSEFYGHLGLQIAVSNKSKLNPAHRRDDAERLLDWAARNEIRLSDALTADIRDGFGTGPDGEDRFDATVGLFGMLNVVLGQRVQGEPADPVVRRIEGWILGLDPATIPAPAD